ncbi:hypothetical protein Hypma_003068 [Hypsizygus marmoreus]|uniref:Uncharacterized protein n=1 Tax=Hypsizygus marmoreus TaxID=39966 RepID=A0A369J2M6_HYPMA|nr:hypothetical protein Hypma_003068 [Hypsizygus marmoreus]
MIEMPRNIQLDVPYFILSFTEFASPCESFSPQTMTNYGMAYFLEDKSGNLTGSEFVDLHDRMRLSYRCTAHDATQSAYMIYDTTNTYGGTRPLLALTFGADNHLGTINFSPESSMLMKKYLTKVSPLGSSRIRKFIASDGQEYRWGWPVKDDQEWTCTNSRGYLVAYYNLKTPGEPEYAHSSGCMLTVEQAYGELVPEMLASLMIMRHIAAYNL